MNRRRSRAATLGDVLREAPEPSLVLTLHLVQSGEGQLPLRHEDKVIALLTLPLVSPEGFSEKPFGAVARGRPADPAACGDSEPAVGVGVAGCHQEKEGAIKTDAVAEDFPVL
jgi:hypothetical protein